MSDETRIQSTTGNMRLIGTEPIDGEFKRLRDELADWWISKAEEEISRTVPKAVEYSSTDLRDIGRDLAALAGRKVTDAEAEELGIYFYIRGKLARWTGALLEGRQVSDDTLFDLGVYVRMVQRIRESGGWPFGPDHK